MPAKKKKNEDPTQAIAANTRTELAVAVSAQVGGDVSAADVARILDAMDKVHDGEELGIVRRNEDGVVAIRVDFRGVAQWLVCGPNGSTHYDMSGTFAGDVLFAPDKSSGEK